VMLKVLGRDFPDPTKSANYLFPVFKGFVSVNGRPVAPDTTMPCDEREAFCGIYGMERSLPIFAALTSGQLSVSFARRTNGLDITLPLDVREAMSSPQNFEAFNSCMGALLERAQKNIGR
jgi:hypothetical protein